MVNLHNIHSLTEFRQNAKRYAEQIRSGAAPLVLTLNGEAALVVESAEAYQATQDRINEMEAEICKLKTAILEAEIAIGFEQAEQGKFSRRTFDEIIANAKASLTSA